MKLRHWLWRSRGRATGEIKKLWLNRLGTGGLHLTTGSTFVFMLSVSLHLTLWGPWDASKQQVNTTNSQHCCTKSIYIYIYIMYMWMSETIRRILRNPATKISNHKPSWASGGPWAYRAQAGRPADRPAGRGGVRRVGGGRPALQHNLVPYGIGTIFSNKTDRNCFGCSHIDIYIYTMYVYIWTYGGCYRTIDFTMCGMFALQIYPNQKWIRNGITLRYLKVLSKCEVCTKRNINVK